MPELPEISRNFSELPEISRNFSELPEISRNFSELPEISSNPCFYHSNRPQNFLRCPGTFQNFLRFPGTSHRNLRVPGSSFSTTPNQAISHISLYIHLLPYISTCGDDVSGIVGNIWLIRSLRMNSSMISLSLMEAMSMSTSSTSIAPAPPRPRPFITKFDSAWIRYIKVA